MNAINSASPVSNRPTNTKSRRNLLAVTAVSAATALLATATTNAVAKPGKPSARKAEGLGMPWEDQYGYAQAVKVGDTIYVSGQLSHDDKGNMVAPAKLDAAGKIADHGNMEAQMRQTYANAKKILARFGASLDNVVEEVLYVTDMDAAFAAAGPVRKEAYGSPKPQVASTILVTPRLALPNQLIEVKLIAKV
jgi:enamine deaminase RidA (YjgF/YER057c/UK114 family)